MQFIPIKTNVLEPPQDDLLAILDDALTDVRAGDVVVVSSKVVAINEGRCVPADDFDKDAHIAAEADLVIPRDYWDAPLTAIHNVFISSAGTDKSNGNGHVVLLPRDPFASARQLHEYLIQRFKVTDIGVIITDSRSEPMRYGATGVAIGWWGISPIESHIGKPDLFGREMKAERSNVVDSIAAAANLVMGEVAEATPVVIARSVPNLSFTTDNTRAELFSSFDDDAFRVLYERFRS